MSNPPSFTLNAINAQGLGLRVVFEWRGDRYGHTIYSVDGNESTPLCASVEGTPTDFWPASPPVQEIVEHELPGGQRTLLLTGQSGKSHWSATVEAAGACLCFDIAVRLKETAPTVRFDLRSVSSRKLLGIIPTIKRPRIGNNGRAACRLRTAIHWCRRCHRSYRTQQPSVGSIG